MKEGNMYGGPSLPLPFGTVKLFTTESPREIKKMAVAKQGKE